MTEPVDDDVVADMKRQQARKTIWVVVALAVVMGGVAAAMLLFGGRIGNDQVEAGRAFLSDCAAGRYEDAHARLSVDLRNRITVAALKKTVQGDKRLRTYRKMGSSHQTIGGGKDYFEGKLEYEGGSVKAQIFLKKEQGNWKVSGLVLGDRDMFSTP